MDVYTSAPATIRGMRIQTSNAWARSISAAFVKPPDTTCGILEWTFFPSSSFGSIGVRAVAFLESCGNDVGTAVNLTMQHGCPFVHANFAGWKEDTLLVDTGCIGGTGSLRQRCIKALLGLKCLADTMTGTSVSASGKVKTSAGRLKQLSLGMLSHNDVLLQRGHSESARVGSAVTLPRHL